MVMLLLNGCARADWWCRMRLERTTSNKMTERLNTCCVGPVELVSPPPCLHTAHELARLGRPSLPRRFLPAVYLAPYARLHVSSSPALSPRATSASCSPLCRLVRRRPGSQPASSRGTRGQRDTHLESDESTIAAGAGLQLQPHSLPASRSRRFMPTEGRVRNVDAGQRERGTEQTYQKLVNILV
jgi:hypothetical protein